MCLFFDRAFPQEILNVMLVRQNLFALLAKFRFMAIFLRFHPANGEIGPGCAVEPSANAPPNRIWQRWIGKTQVGELSRPTGSVALLGFCHSQENCFALLVGLTRSQIMIRLCRINFCPPIALNYFCRLGSIFCSIRWIVALHLAQPAPAIEAVMAEAGFAFICCAVITTATEPIINPAPTSVPQVNFSLAKAVPSKTATTGVT